MLTFFMGSYTEYLLPDFGGTGKGIYTVQMKLDSGELNILHTQYCRNPSYLAISADNQFLYCSTELEVDKKPKVKAFKINDDHSLDFINEQPIAGGYPCHLSIYNSNVLVACYATGNVVQFPLDSYGKILPCKKNIFHSGSSINSLRQEAPHAHQVSIHPNTGDIYVCDLGIDTIKAYVMHVEELNPNVEKDCHVSEGGGPRHLTFNQKGDLAYVLNELTGKVSVLRSEDEVFQQIDSVNSLPHNYSSKPSGSAIRLHPNGTHLYAGNRGSNSIAIFEIRGGELSLVNIQYTHGDEVREFNITPDGQWLIACHQNSHDTIVYKIQEDGLLLEAFRTQEILSPVCISFLNE